MASPARLLTVPVCEVRTTVTECAGNAENPGQYTVSAVDVPLDEAYEISDRLLYGPAVYVWLSGGSCMRGLGASMWARHFRVTVRALTESEAADACLEALPLLVPRLPGLRDSLMRRYRLRFGELCAEQAACPEGYVTLASTPGT